MAVISRFEAFFHSTPVEPALWSGSGPTRTMDHIVLRVTDSDDAVGYGECDAIPGAMAILAALGERLLGLDPLAREVHLAGLRRQLVTGFPISAFSIALDDLVARRLGVTIAALYGGPFRTRVQPYAASYGSIQGRTLESWVDVADALAGRGFAAMKLRLGVLPVGEECRALEDLRKRAPASLQFMADGNGGFNRTTSREMGRCAQDVGLLWFEEPLPPHNGYVGYPELAEDLAIPLAGGELSDSRAMAFDLLSRRGVDIIQPDPLICGGIGETIFIGALARLFGRLCV